MRPPSPERDANRDPLTGAPGAHPLGVGVGAATGGVVAAAVAGTLAAGPVGTVVGAAIGAVAGGLGGKVVAEHFDPTVEDAYWRGHHAEQPYSRAGDDYERFAPAYRLGWESRLAADADSFDDAEPALRDRYAGMEVGAAVPWERARNASRAAWNRVGDGI